MNIQNDIRETNIKLKERIDEIETASLKLLPGLFEGKQNSLLKIKEQITKCQGLSFETNEISEPKENEIESNNFDWIIKNYTVLQQYTKMSRCVKMILDEVGTTYIPLKLVERIRGQFVTESNENNTLICQKDDLVVIKDESNRWYRQTNNSNENNVTGSNADFDFSSDDVENEFPITLKLHGLKHQITKIVPVSEDIIWIQVENCLYKLDQEKGSAVKSQDNVDDFTMMNDKSLLLLNKSNQYITKRFQDGRTLKFAGVHPFSPLWLDISEDKVAIVVKEERTQFYSNGNPYKSSCYNVVIFCNKGIKLYEIKEVSLPASYRHILGVKLTKSNSMFFINKTEVVCMDLDTKEKRISKEFLE
ncbi:unnamed protein product [Mytilus coruscus]|uniref:Uncharacterized protein n=1 Tax=Mytilus coruscus TaxID=42192 RepID=A0A6J8BYM1_MYTCO|nr:unnamed protein product [Mytilus coruscus]